jgi:hypothetical protein
MHGIKLLLLHAWDCCCSCLHRIVVVVAAAIVELLLNLVFSMFLYGPGF